jgi:hypothetical protein
MPCGAACTLQQQDITADESASIFYYSGRLPSPPRRATAFQRGSKQWLRLAAENHPVASIPSQNLSCEPVTWLAGRDFCLTAR